MSRLGEIGGVLTYIRVPVGGDGVFVENGRNGAYRLTGRTVDALVRVDVEHGLGIVAVDAIDWTHVYACRVFHSNARFGNYVGHEDENSRASLN